MIYILGEVISFVQEKIVHVQTVWVEVDLNPKNSSIKI